MAHQMWRARGPIARRATAQATLLVAYRCTMMWRQCRRALAQVDPALESAPDLAADEASPRHPRFLDLQGWIQILAGIVIALTALIVHSSGVEPSGIRVWTGSGGVET